MDFSNALYTRAVFYINKIDQLVSDLQDVPSDSGWAIAHHALEIICELEASINILANEVTDEADRRNVVASRNPTPYLEDALVSIQTAEQTTHHLLAANYVKPEIRIACDHIYGPTVIKRLREAGDSLANGVAKLRQMEIGLA